MHGYLCSPGFEEALVTEMAGLGAAGGCRVVGPGLVTGPSLPPVDTDFVHARHILPDIRWLTGASIRSLARASLDAVWPALKALMTWRLDVFTLDTSPDLAELERRAELLDSVIREEVLARRRALHRVLGDDPTAPRLQVLLVDRDRAMVSLATPSRLSSGATWPSPWIAGRAPVTEDRDAPSSAYRKLLEAFAWIGARPGPGDRVADLGASPGGWSWVAVGLGATVVGVDKGAMDPRLLDDPAFRHERRDAFSWQPPDAPVDWLICDIIADPTRSADLLVSWAKAHLFRSAIVHLKVMGAPRPDLAREVEAAVRAAGYAFARTKQLRHDKNELTVMVREHLSPEPASAGAP